MIIGNNRIYVELWPVTSIPGTEKMDGNINTYRPASPEMPTMPSFPGSSHDHRGTRFPTWPDQRRQRHCNQGDGIALPGVKKLHALWICITGIEVISYHFNLFFNILFGDLFQSPSLHSRMILINHQSLYQWNTAMNWFVTSNVHSSSL